MIVNNSCFSRAYAGSYIVNVVTVALTYFLEEDSLSINKCFISLFAYQEVTINFVAILSWYLYIINQVFIRNVEAYHTFYVIYYMILKAIDPSLLSPPLFNNWNLQGRSCSSNLLDCSKSGIHFPLFHRWYSEHFSSFDAWTTVPLYIHIFALFHSLQRFWHFVECRGDWDL